MTTARPTAGLVALVLVLGCASIVSAQAPLQLPGAVSGGAGGSGSPGGGASGAAPPPPKPISLQPPTEDTIASHPLSRDGDKGEMTFDKAGAGLSLSKLSLVGDKISKPGQACTVEVPLSPPLAATPDGRPAGAIRYGVTLQACPFNVDILDGAVLVTTTEPLCEFSAADCRVAIGGLWGPHAADITPKRAQDLERDRLRLETTMRANFRALLHKAGKDKVAIKALAAQQAAFSSEREMTCRDYQQESTHGFCSTQITEARALSLLAQFGPVKAAHDRRLVPRAKAKAPVAADETDQPQ